MAADIMAPQVQFRNRIAFYLLALLFIVSACKRSGVLVHINRADKEISQIGDVLLYHHKPFTGITYELYDNGDTSRTIKFKDGKETGLTKCWYPNKQLAQLRTFENGKKQGKHLGWWPNGKVKFEYHFVDDEHEGELREWFDNGKLFRYFHYKMGHEAGSEKMWWEDGKIRANYVIINGEKFGLFGEKICANKAETVNGVTDK